MRFIFLALAAVFVGWSVAPGAMTWVIAIISAVVLIAYVVTAALAPVAGTVLAVIEPDDKPTRGSSPRR